MLEHADRDDPVERPLHRAVVQQFEPHPVGEALGLGAGARLGELLGRQRDAGDAGAVIARQRQRHAAPAAADIEHGQIGPVEQQLGGDVALLRRLRLVDRLVAAREIGAGILPVAIEEEAVEPAVQVVVVRRVAPRAARGVELRDATHRDVEALAQRQHRMPPSGRARLASARSAARRSSSRPAPRRRPYILRRGRAPGSIQAGRPPARSRSGPSASGPGAPSHLAVGRPAR